MSLQNPTVPAPTRDLVIRATILFPLAAYLDPAAVRSARRGWIRAMLRRASPGPTNFDRRS